MQERDFNSHTFSSPTELYLCDCRAPESLAAVHPSLAARRALGPVVPLREDGGGHAGGPGQAEVEALPAVMGRRGSGEDARHHVEGEQDLGQTDPHVQNLLVFAEASGGREELVEIHCGEITNNWRCSSGIEPVGQEEEEEEEG